jgi:hypothetical protein
MSGVLSDEAEKRILGLMQELMRDGELNDFIFIGRKGPGGAILSSFTDKQDIIGHLLATLKNVAERTPEVNRRFLVNITPGTDEPIIRLGDPKEEPN